MEQQTNTTDPCQNDCIRSFLDYFSITNAYLLVFFCILGAIANLFSVFIFLQTGFREISINLLLGALSCYYFCLLTLGLFTLVPGPMYGFYAVPLFYEIHLFGLASLYPLSAMFTDASVWLLVVVTFERWVAVCKPFLVKKYCTRKRAVMAVLTVSLASVSYNMVKFWEFRIDKVDGVKLPLLELRANTVYMLWYQTVSNLLFVYMVPLLLLIMLSSLIGIQLIRDRRTRRLISRNQRTTLRTTRMLLYIVLAFIIGFTSSFLLNMLETVKPQLFQRNIGFMLNDVNNLLVTANAAIEPMFYYKFSTRYRLMVKFILKSLVGASHPVLASTSSFYSSLSLKKTRRIRRKCLRNKQKKTDVTVV